MSLNWSISREKTLNDCERRYYFEYLAGARSNSRDPRLREIARLKRLKTIALWQGDVFHAVAAEAARMIRVKGMPPAVDLVALADERLRREWAQSAPVLESPEALVDASDDDGLILFEHYYGMPMDPGTLEIVCGRVASWVGRFVDWAAHDGFVKKVESAQRVWIEPQGFGASAIGFGLDGVQITTRVDLALRHRDVGFEIYDWKTGNGPSGLEYRTDDEEYQVTVYQIWAETALGVPLDEVHARVVYVASDPVIVRPLPIDGEVRERARRRLSAAIGRARAIHGVGDYAPLVEADFELALSPGACRWCRYKRLCKRMVDL